MKTLLLLSLISLSACGIKIGQGVVMGTTSFLEEVNKGQFVGQLETRVRENISEQDRNNLSVRLAEVK